MSETTTNGAATTPAPEAPAAPTGLPCVQLPCPCCGEPNSNIALNLWMLDDEEGHFTCNECNGEFTLDTVRQILRRWGPIVAWIEQIPAPAAE